MWMDTESDENELGDDDAPGGFPGRDDVNAYWRRRFFLLGGAIALLGLCAWFLPGARSSAKPASPAASASAAALARGAALPPAAYGNAWQAHPARPHANRKTQVPKHVALGPGQGALRCRPGDIVLSLLTSEPSYGRNMGPRFDVYAVSTSARPCTLSYGPGAVHVVVTRRGHVVWDSAACGASSEHQVRFTLGVPQVLAISWNRHATGAPGCAGSLAAGTWGTFDAVAMTDGQSSPVRPFQIAR